MAKKQKAPKTPCLNRRAISFDIHHSDDHNTTRNNQLLIKKLAKLLQEQKIQKIYVVPKSRLMPKNSSINLRETKKFTSVCQ